MDRPSISQIFNVTQYEGLDAFAFPPNMAMACARLGAYDSGLRWWPSASIDLAQSHRKADDPKCN